MHTSTFCNAFVGSGGGVREFARPLGADDNPNFSLCSKWLPFLCTGSSAKVNRSLKFLNNLIYVYFTSGEKNKEISEICLAFNL